jgi:RND family efflux transporter MFP subunit
VGTRTWIVALAAAGSLLAACSHDHGHEHGKAGDAEQPGSAVTHYTQHTELFVEFPPLVSGQEIEFAAHLTRLGDFKPVDAGRLVVRLGEDTGETEVSDTAGIFKPALTPREPGRRRLGFSLEAPGLTVTHDLGEVEVFPDAKSAAAAAPKPVEGAIRYTKEQQWREEFEVREAASRTVRESIAVTALIRPRAAGEARIAAPSPGVLQAGPVQVGTRVAAGQVLGSLLPRLGSGSDIAALELAVSRTRLDAELAAQELARLEKLLEAEAVAAKRVDEARHRDRVAKAELAAALRRADAYQGGSGGIPLRSPVAGTVVALAGQPGTAFEEGQAIFHVADLGRLWLEAQVPESDLGRVRAPAGAFFRLDGEGRTFVLDVGRNARLVAFAGLVNPDTRTVAAILEFDNPDGRLKAGMQVRAGLYTGRGANGMAVPASAVVDDAGQAVLFVQKGGERFERRPVTPGLRDGDWIAIPSGLAAGERVVTRGAWQVRLAASAPAQAGHGHTH